MVVDIIGWSVTAAAVSWGLTLSWASAAMARSQDAMQEDIDRWQAEAFRARQMVIQLKHEAAMWSRGRQDGREDLIAMMPLLVAAQQGLADASVSDRASADD
ncbi:MAG TPA: hypothetical protein VMB74_04465 [Streptosporangiaceae bacterium]|nr:hypothetical protein [Streptosporangiaceae bacterium]